MRVKGADRKVAVARVHRNPRVLQAVIVGHGVRRELVFDAADVPPVEEDCATYDVDRRIPGFEIEKVAVVATSFTRPEAAQITGASEGEQFQRVEVLPRELLLAGGARIEAGREVPLPTRLSRLLAPTAVGFGPGL